MCKVNSTLCRTSVGTNVCVFPMVLFLIWFDLSYYNLFIFDLSHCILFDYYSLYTASFFDESQKGCGCGWEGKWTGTGRSKRQRKPQSEHIVGKGLFSVK